MNSEKWEVTWHFGKYELGWYLQKIFLFIPIHIAIGFSVSYAAMYFTYFPLWVCFLFSLLAGILIESIQMIREGFSWNQKHEKLLGHIRDIITYMTLSWLIFII